jgi:hypothetical protein
MGPTCAQRGVYSRLDGDDSLTSQQISFDGELGSQTKQPLPQKPRSRSLSSQRELPSHLRSQYQLAKMAFDDLFREFCKNGTLLYGERALAFDHLLNNGDFEVHGFDDPLLDWLEPEHELQLFLSPDGRTAFHRRCINGTVSLLHFNIDPSNVVQSSAAKKCIEIIASFRRSLREYRDKEKTVQLSLFSNDPPVRI